MSVELAQNAAGDYALGATIDGVFIPFVSTHAGRVKQLQDRHADLVAKSEDESHEGHGPAIDVLESDWQVVKSSASSGSSSSGGKSKSELLELADEYGVEGLTTRSTKAAILEALEDAGYEDEG